MSWLARLAAVIRPRVGRGEALALARAECEARGWPWREPVHVARELGAYRVTTAADRRGGNVNVRVSVVTGAVLSAAFAAR